MSRSDKDRFTYFLHSADSRMWRHDGHTGCIAFFGGLEMADWRIHSRGRTFFHSVEDWESYSGTPVLVLLGKSKKRRRRKNVVTKK